MGCTRHGCRSPPVRGGGRNDAHVLHGPRCGERGAHRDQPRWRAHPERGGGCHRRGRHLRRHFGPRRGLRDLRHRSRGAQGRSRSGCDLNIDPPQSGTRAARLISGELMGTANFGIVGLDWQQRVNWDRLKNYRTERAREHMKKHGLGAMLCMYDENVRYLTGTLTPGWNRLKPGLRYALLCGDGQPVLFEQGDLGFQIERHSPWIPQENVRASYAWIKGAGGAGSTQQGTKFTNAIIEEMQRHGVAGQKLGVDFIDINMIQVFKDKNI